MTTERTVPPELDLEYNLKLQQLKAEIPPIAGTETLLDTILDRYARIYAHLRFMESDYRTMDLQRYNQLTGIWIKVGQDLIGKYKELYEKGAADKMAVERIMTVVAEELDDNQLSRIRERLARAATAK